MIGIAIFNINSDDDDKLHIINIEIKKLSKLIMIIKKYGKHLFVSKYLMGLAQYLILFS